jgi:hypothetical protein
VKRIGLLLMAASALWMVACGSSGGGNNGGNNGGGSTITSVTVSCSPTNLSPNQTSNCSATVTGTGNFSTGVSWTASAGSISTSGVFTAPVVPATTSVTITATSSQDTSKSGSTTITVNPAGTITSVTISCAPSTIQYGQTSQCSASVSGTGNFSSAVTWSASAGSISTTGLFTAPSSGNASLLVTVTATSVQDSTKSGSTTVTVNPSQQANNVQPIVVDAGPAPQSFITANAAYVTVTVCVPGTNTCQSIDHVMVDTGSSGLRLLSSPSGGELNIPLPQVNDSSGNPLYECLVFLDGYIWGNVAQADIEIAGEKASSASVHVIVPSSASQPPGSCSSQNPPGGYGNEGNSLMAFGANGILGVGLFQQDCGLACTPGFQLQDVYYDCPASGCKNPTSVTLAQQVSNPVIFFAADNNGVLVQLPAVPNGGSQTVDGSLIFGIGTQANNGLGSANVYVVPDSGANAGDIVTVFPPGGAGYNQSFLDSGSNGIFFLDSNATGIPMCASPNNTWYCPTTSPDNLTATNQGQALNGAVGSPITVDFSIEDATTLFNNNGNNTAFSTLGGPNPGSFDWGLAFFYGRNVFTAIENLTSPGEVGPYYAY